MIVSRKSLPRRRAQFNPRSTKASLAKVESLSTPASVLMKVAAALRWPARPAWARLAIEAAWSLPLALLLCALGGLADFGWAHDPGLFLRLAAVALIAPAFGEELLFRVLLLPPPGRPVPPSRIALSAALFVLWHPPQAWLFGPHWAAVVLNPFFLGAVAVLGVALARLYARTGSIWPCVPLHWIAIMAWKAFFGAPSPWVGG